MAEPDNFDSDLGPVRESTVEVTIWANEGRKGTFYKATTRNSYNDGNQWHDTESYDEDDLAALATAALNARAKMRKLRLQNQKTAAADTAK